MANCYSSTTLDPDNFEVPFFPLFHYSGTDPNGDNDASTCMQSNITDIPGNLGVNLQIKVDHSG